MNSSPSQPTSSPDPFIDSPFFRGFLFVLFLVLVATYVVLIDFTNEQQRAQPQGMSPQFHLLARYSVGLGQLAQMAAREGQGTDRILPVETRTQLVEQLLQVALTPDDRLRAVVVVAELQDPETARNILSGVREAEPPLEILNTADLLEAVYAEPVGTVNREALEERLGWYGKLAAGTHLVEDDPYRTQPRMAALSTCLMVIVWFMGLLATLGAGVVVSGFAMVQMRRGKLAFFQQALNLRLPKGRGAFMEAMVLFIWILLFSAMLPAWIPAAVRFMFLLLPVGWLVLRGLDRQQIILGVGLHAGKGIWREMACGALGYLAGVPLAMLGFALTFLIVGITGNQPSHPIVESFAGASWLDMLGLLVLVCGVAPLVEEILFRGIFYHYLRGTMGALMAALVSGFFFAVIHPQGLAAIPMLASIGMIFALIREWRGSLIGSMTAHALNNTIPVTLMFIMFH
ncbi:CPBP family intramembrane metalloprotease [Sulfidibacter corallicola]|uniref:CPBP family intramembrane metalloprotease n=1 Tax=Sulfidibacter corallicola TaxID=2818388 RepID=A0A8A4TGJ4_SULCO|nr:type II CAAX endopeptidase family protein [Sulfidibacter corallicola]QTD47911.1 CPBP family intramembrane metalloprotease [Sulfidibacter corallicola]